MGKSKSTKAGGTVPHKHLHSRISYLHQAATYLTTNGTIKHDTDSTLSPLENSTKDKRAADGPQDFPKLQASRLLEQLRGVSLKSQIRLTSKLKHTICRRCNALLIPGLSSTESVSNKSKSEKKPWADVLEIKCKACGTVKRFPVGSRRHKGDERAKLDGLAVQTPDIL